MTRPILIAFSILMLTSCPSRDPAGKGATPSDKTSECKAVTEILEKIAKFVLSQEATLDAVVVSVEELASLQNGVPSPDAANRTALNEQLRSDIIRAASTFKETNRPTDVVGMNNGELIKAAPIENIAPEVDQVRDASITFTTPTGEKTFQVGMLVNVNGCWKILYI